MWRSALGFLTRGSAWWLKSLIAAIIAAFVFSCAPAVWMFDTLELPPAYQLKSEDPMADTATLTIPEHPGERSHGAKLTPRLFGSWLLYFATQASLHPYWPATFGGVVLLLSGIVVGNKLTGDRVTGLYSGLLLAGLYCSNACFSMNHGPKPFDGVAIGMVALTLLWIDVPILMGIAAFLACWTDERAIVSLLLIAMVVHLRPIDEDQSRSKHYGALGLAVLIYFVTRVFIGKSQQWSVSDVSMLGDNLAASFSYTQMATWNAFEGGLIFLPALFWLSRTREKRSDLWWLIGAGIVAIGSCLIVLDISRAAAFAFPLLFAAIMLMRQWSGHVKFVQRTVGLAATLSLLCSNVEIISSIAYSPLPTTPIVLWLRWFS